MKLALDTNAYADLKRGTLWSREVAEAKEVHLSTVVLGELYFGFAGGRDRIKNLGELEDFIGMPSVTIDSICQVTAACYGELYQFLRIQGTPIPANDIWIAASAIVNGCFLLTRDRHFECLPQVRVRWPVG